MSAALLASAVLLVTSTLGLLGGRAAALRTTRWLARRDGVSHLGSGADRALARLRELVVEVEHVLTTGHLVVVDVEPLDPRNTQDLRWFAGALAHVSTDPVARAIARLSGPGRTSSVREGPGPELRGSVDRHPVRIGPNGRGHDDADIGTTVSVEVDLRPMGHIVVADEVRPSAASRLSVLRARGVTPVLVSPTMRPADLARVAAALDVPRFRAGSDAGALLAMLDRDGAGSLRAVGEDAPAGELALPARAGEDAVVRCADPSVDAAVTALPHLLVLRTARRSAAVGAGLVAVAAAVATALTGLSPAAAVAVAAGGVALVAALAALVALVASPTTAGDP